MNEARSHYACLLRMDDGESFVVWFSDLVDDFLRHPSGRLMAAGSLEALESAACSAGVVLEDEPPADYDFRRIQAWCDRPEAAKVVCSDFLDIWNLLDDLAGLHRGVDSHYVTTSRAAGRVYEKLFWGNNLLSVTPPGRRFDPTWSPEELNTIRCVMLAGLSLLEDELRLSRTMPPSFGDDCDPSKPPLK